MMHGMQVEGMSISRCEIVGRSPSRLAVLLAWTLGAAVSWVPVHVDAKPVSVAGGALRVDVADGVQVAAELPERLAKDNPKLAQELAEGPGRARWIAVEIEGEYLDFRYRVTPMRDGEAVGGVGEWVACKGSNEELVEEIDKGIAAAVERLREPVASSEVEVPARQEEHSATPEPEPQYRTMTGLGIGGIVAGAVGASGVVVGGVFLGLGERLPEEYTQLERDYRPPGVAFLVSGGVVLGAGVAMLVTDLVQCRRQHPRCMIAGGSLGRAARPRGSIAPWLGARGVGLVGRF